MELKKLVANKIAEILDKDSSEIEKSIEKSPNLEMGDFSFPCFRLAKEFRKSPQDIARNIKEKLVADEIEKVEVISGYVNIFIKKDLYAQTVIEEIETKQYKYGSENVGEGKKALIEHTSINPNASPHIGRARNALIGDSIVKLLKFNNYEVETHYFVNDIGKQISMLLVGTKGKDNVTFDELLQLYIDINKEVKENKELEQEVFDNLNKLENGDEETIFIKPCTETKNVAIVGAGLAGLEAARVAYKRGHTVTVFEKSDRLGGQINIASVPPRKDEILRSVQYYEKFLSDKVDIQLNHEPTMDELNGFDHVILAIGAHNMDLPMPVENSNVVSSWDILNG